MASDVVDDSPKYPMTDLSAEGPGRWLAEHGTVARLRLDDTFTRANQRYDLSIFGFRDDDPVSEAAAWAVERFRVGIDLARLAPKDRNERLFEQMNFWLAQKVSAPALPAVKARADRRHLAGRGRSPKPPPVRSEPGEPRFAVELRPVLARALHGLASRTCNSMVTYWLEAAAALGIPGGAPSGKPDAGSSKGLRARYRSLAVFRWTAIVLDEAGPPEPSVEEKACEVAFFTPCPDKRPYRNDGPSVARALAERAPGGAAAVRRAVRLGAAELLERLLDRTESVQLAEVELGLAAMVVRRSLGTTVLKALSIEGTPEGRLLGARLKDRRAKA